MRRVLPRHRLAAAAVAPLLLVSVTSCSSGDPASSGEDVSSQAPATGSSESPGSSAESPTGSSAADAPEDALTTESFLPALQEAAEGQESVHVELDLDGGGQQAFTAEGDSRLDETSPAMELTLSGPAFGDQTAELIAVDDLVYISGLPGTPPDKFVRIDPNDPNDPLGQGFGGLTDQLDPRSTFEAFEAGLERVEYVGEETVQGDPTEKYRVFVDSAKALRAQGQPAVPGLPKTLEYLVWVDENDLMRRVSFQLGPISFDGNLSGWGEPVDVEAPPPSDIVERPQQQPQG